MYAQQTSTVSQHQRKWASLKNVGQYHSGLVNAAQHSINFTWLITYSIIQILGSSEMTSLSGGVLGVVKRKYEGWVWGGGGAPSPE